MRIISSCVLSHPFLLASGNFHFLTLLRFSPSRFFSRYYDLGWLLTINLVSTIIRRYPYKVRETSPDKNVRLHLIYPPTLLNIDSDSYRTLPCSASSSYISSLLFVRPRICRLLPSDSTSLGNPCYWLTIPTIRARSELSPYSVRPC